MIMGRGSRNPQYIPSPVISLAQFHPLQWESIKLSFGLRQICILTPITDLGLANPMNSDCFHFLWKIWTFHLELFTLDHGQLKLSVVLSVSCFEMRRKISILESSMGEQEQIFARILKNEIFAWPLTNIFKIGCNFSQIFVICIKLYVFFYLRKFEWTFLFLSFSFTSKYIQNLIFCYDNQI